MVNVLNYGKKGQTHMKESFMNKQVADKLFKALAVTFHVF